MPTPPREGEILFYATPSGPTRLEVLFEDESFWLTQKRMAELFEVGVPTINHHLKEIFASGELVEDRTIRKIRTVQTEGARCPERLRQDGVATGHATGSRAKHDGLSP